MERYLTKSRFKMALDCPPKLFYCNKDGLYADNNLDDSFLAALAEGGFQVGELAKYLMVEDPQRDKITIQSKDYKESVEITLEKLTNNDDCVIAEAAFLFDNLFVRVDILRKNGNLIEIFEVKSKSWNSEKTFWSNPRKGDPVLLKDWRPYLYDIAFQKYVVQNAFPNYTVNAFLVLADNDTHVEIDGLNQLFRLIKTANGKKVEVKADTLASQLGKIPLKIIPVDYECNWIYENNVDVDLPEEYSFEGVIKLFSQAYKNDQRIWSPIGRKCKECQFVNSNSDPQLRSGFSECWHHWSGLNEEQLKMPLALELWGGKAGSRSLVNDIIRSGKYFIEQIGEDDYWPKKYEPVEFGLHAAERRKIQISKVRDRDVTAHLDKEGLTKIFQKLKPPFHFIDFETSMAALPFHKGRRPYEGIAFQYSYHLMTGDGQIEHKSQFLSLEPEFPNYEFVRKMKIDLSDKTGTIFRYHNHENTYLNLIYKQISAESEATLPDKAELLNFIECITHDKAAGRCGPGDMEDLYQIVLSYYYSPHAKGSNSLKHILPAVINDSEFIRIKYSKPIYGTREIPSLNFTNHTWISEENNFNPYNSLPRVFEGYENEQMDQFIDTDDEIREGGAAMMAYAYAQYTDMPADQKKLIAQSLFRYCELDTMAMVMVWEYFGNEIGFFK